MADYPKQSKEQNVSDHTEDLNIEGTLRARTFNEDFSDRKSYDNMYQSMRFYDALSKVNGK